MKITLFVTLVAITLLASTNVGAANLNALPTPYQGNLHLFLLIGQSNMSGHGVMPSVRKIDPMAWNIGDDYRWRPVQEPNDHQTAYPTDPVNYDATATYGPTLPFTLHMHTYAPDYPIGVITCARGGSSMLRWQYSIDDQTLYGACLKRTYAAQLYGRVAGAIIFQGEAETEVGLEDQANAWGANFTQLLASLRAQYGDIPVVFAQIGMNAPLTKYPNQNIVRAQQESIDLQNTAMIYTDDLATQSDGVHFTSNSYNQIGCRFADKISILLGLGDGSLPCVFN